jgi:hypothetical protein
VPYSRMPCTRRMKSGSYVGGTTTSHALNYLFSRINKKRHDL